MEKILNIDTETKMRCGVVVGLALASLGISKMAIKKVDVSALKYVPEGICYDAELVKSFIALQQYEGLSPYLFKTIFMNVDQLLFLEHQLMTKKLEPRQEQDNIVGMCLFRAVL